ncbi:MAG: alpha/beta hydrolase family esterase [Acidimicrobiales bacterium]
MSTTTSTATEPAPSEATKAAAGVAWTPTLEPGQITMPNGDVREYRYLRPDPTVSDPVPLVLVFHGGGGNPETAANQFGFMSLQDPLPFLTVFPQGTDVSPPPGPVDAVWNSGHSYAGSQIGADDVEFVDQLLIELTRRTATAGWRIDQSRTYACGFSNGGMMTYRLAAERSQEFAAVAVICSSIGGVADSVNDSGNVHINDPALHDGEPVAVLHLQGLLDEGNPFYGGIERTRANPRSDLPTIDAMELWASHNSCRPNPRIESTPHGVLRTWPDGDGDTEVKLLAMPGRGHAVPEFTLDMILPFFNSHSK